MQKDLLKLALTGLAAGVCLSAQGGGEIAMAKCSRTPPPAENPTDPQIMDDTTPDDDMNCSSCNAQGGSCASYGGQGDQSSQNEAPSLRNFLEPKRLSAAKAVIERDNGQGMDK